MIGEDAVMGKKREQCYYHIDNINMEIDYEKLAEAIVKAQAKAQQKKPKLNFRAKAMRFFNGVTYSVVYVIAASAIYTIWADCFPAETVSLCGSVLLTALLVFAGAYAFLCQQEAIYDSGDASTSHFNTNVALIALIIALVALMKGAA